MRQHIDTIPLWEAYKADCECPLCYIEQQNEEMYVESFLGGSVMEPATRVEVNEKGFCADHCRMLLFAGNKLGVALMAHTHLKEIMNEVLNYTKVPVNKAAPLFSMFSKKEPSAVQDVRFVSSCILCDRLQHTMDRYVYTLFHLWKTDAEFKKAFEASKGLCLPHYARVIHESGERLSGADASAFINVLTKVEKENLNRLENEIEWFTLKFDYRNADKPWGMSHDAVERTLSKLRGYRSSREWRVES